jgi:S-methylmethionine-dependent homocysteine/selenocysteine methylase
MVKILDGGLSTELENLGAKIEGSLWTGRALLEDPSAIEQAHKNFISAGAEVVITSSYQISRRGFEEIGLTAAEADAALRQSVEVAKRAAAGTGALVAASIGPFGAVLHDGSEYRGNYGLTEDELFTFHAERIAILEQAGPDILLAETIPDLVEAQALARALATAKLPVWISFSATEGSRLWSGSSVADAVSAVAKIPTLEAIGFNCVNPDLVTELVASTRTVTDLPIAIYPNKGGVWNSELGEWDSQKVKSLDQYWPDWQGLGLAYVGGCCGSNSHDIAELAKSVSRS